MKTRSNMPLFVLEVSDVKALSNSQIDLLRCGDYLVKKDASGEHAYKVTFKSATGMCITYHDAYCVETQSYDKIDGVWTYNSEDKTIIAEPSLENIVDKDGHKRFIDFDITTKEIEGVEYPYAKASLSGSHLMIVICMNVANGTTLSATDEVAKIPLPNWILDKISPLYNINVSLITTTFYASGGTSQTVNSRLQKKTGYLAYDISASLTLNADRSARVVFDLLIDNE